MIIDDLILKTRQTSPICVGLDPVPEMLPSFLIKDYDVHNAILRFNQGIIGAIKDLVPIIKPQIACYERIGAIGLSALKITLEYAKNNQLMTIVDAKRGDIASTAESYSDAFLKSNADFEADFLTVNPYLGSDGVLPFLKNCEEYDKGIFVLVKTSNPSSGEIQDQKLENGMYVFELMAEYVSLWGSSSIGQSGFSRVGAVVGATFPEQAKLIREILPNNIFLVPGFGAQGGTAEDIRPCFDVNNEGVLVNSSRAIIYAYKNRPDLKEQDFALAAREEVLRMKEVLKF